MKKIELIKIHSDEATVSDYQDHYSIINEESQPVGYIENASEFLLGYYADVEHMPIKKMRINDREYYVAVHPRVWEWLYLLENPVTAESQESRISSITNSFKKMRAERNLYKGKVSKVNIWARIKWAFTGVKL